MIRTSVDHFWRNGAIATAAFAVCVIGIGLLGVNGAIWGVGPFVWLWRAAFPDVLVRGGAEPVRIDGRVVVSMWALLAILFGVLVARRPRSNLAIFVPIAVVVPIVVFNVTIRVLGFRLA